MEFYKFDQEPPGKYQYSNHQAKKSPAERRRGICSTLKNSVFLQIFFGILFLISAVFLFRSHYCAPLYIAILWIFTWNVTALRIQFCIRSEKKFTAQKNQSQETIVFLRRLSAAHFVILLWFFAAVGSYCCLDIGFSFIGNLLITGIALTMISYGVSHLSCNQKLLRWWDFSNDTEGYWHLGE